MSQTKQGWLSVHRSRYVIFFYKALGAMVAPAYAVPLTILDQTGTLTTTSPSATASAISPESNRDGSFQVLADGTQDLAALVGIFATNSVERYAFDHSKGFMSSAVSVLSLLGLLGYIRALFKLSLGPDYCENAGFDTKDLRTYFGEFDADRAPANEIYKVCYVERQVDDHRVRWKHIRDIEHTRITFALQHKSDHLGATSEFTVMSFQLNYNDWTMIRVLRVSTLGNRIFSSIKGAPFVVLVSGASAVCVGLTSCLVVPLRGPSPPNWSLYFATVGLIVPISFTSTAWAWVYAREQLPHVGLDWNQSWFDSNHFAYIRKGEDYFVLDLRLIRGHSRRALRAISLIAALLAIAGYVLQISHNYSIQALDLSERCGVC